MPILPVPPVRPSALLLVAAGGLFFSASLRADPGVARLYWTDKDDGQLEASDPDGGNRVTLLSGLLDPRGIALDPSAGKLYWASHAPYPNGAIYMADCDGSNVEFFLDFMPEVADLAIDLENRMLYWAEEDENRICCTSLDAPEGLDIVVDGLNRPYYIEIDPAAGHLYWSDFDSGVIHRAPLDGSGDPSDFITGQARVRDLALADGMLYWCDRDSSQIRRRALDGSGSGTVLFSGAADSLDRPHGLCLDPATGTMFWTDTDMRQVNRAAMDGSGNVTTLVGTGLTGAWGITLSKPPLTPYQEWLTQYFTPAELADPTSEATLWGELADPDRDGALNLLEFGTGTNPLEARHDPDAFQLTLVTESGDRFLDIVFRMRADDAELSVAIESSDSLEAPDWQEGEFTEIPPRSDDAERPGYQFVTVRSPSIDASRPSKFARLVVSR